MTFPQPAHIIRPKYMLKDLKKKCVHAIVNLEGNEGKGYDGDLKAKKDSHEMLPQLNVDTLKDAPIKEFVRKMVKGEELNN